MSESSIQRAILKYLKSLGLYCWTIKISICNERGAPDIICCYKGFFVGLEVKTPRGRPSQIQKTQILRINNARGRAKVVRSVEEVKELLKELDEEDEQGDP